MGLASTRHSPAFFLYGYKLVLLFEHASCSLVYVTVASVDYCIYAMREIIALVHSSMACLAALIAETAIWHHWAIAITFGKYAWLPTEHLKIPPPISHKLSACFVRLLPVLHAIIPAFF